MRVVVYGLWHLGCVTAGCLARAGHDVIGLDADPALVADLSEGRPDLPHAPHPQRLRNEPGERRGLSPPSSRRDKPGGSQSGAQAAALRDSSTHGLACKYVSVRSTASRMLSFGRQPRARTRAVSRKMNGLSPIQPRSPPV